MKTKSIRDYFQTGIVTQFDANKNFGIVVVQGNEGSHRISKDTGPFLVGSGMNLPFFTGRRSNRLPSNGDLITFVIGNNDGKPTVTHWSHERDWNAAEALIAGRKQIRPAASARFMNKIRTAVMQKQNKAPVAMPKSTEPKPLRTVIFSTACVA